MAPPILLDLPNEVLIHMLTPFSTHSLLSIALVSTRFHDLVLRILHHRLALAAALREHKIIFEGFHPGHKNIEPYLFCDYLGTPGLSSKEDNRDDPIYFEHDGKSGFGRLGSLYSYFRPVPPEEKAKLRRQHPAAQGLQLQEHDENVRQPFGAGRIISDKPMENGSSSQPLAKYIANLDPDEGFTQMSMVTNLVKLGPRRGLFEHIVNVADQTVRLKRDWMKRVAASTPNIESGVQNDEEEQVRTLWVDEGKNIGIKVRMKERSMPRRVAPVLWRDSDPAVSYVMEYDTLLIRTTRLLLAVEEALMQDHNSNSIESLDSIMSGDDSVWRLAEDIATDDRPPISIEERISRLSALLLQRDGLVRSESWL